MKLKHIIPALFGLSACFACSSGNLVNNKTTIPPQSEDNPISYLNVTFDLNGGTYNDLPTFVMENVIPTSYWKYLADKAPGSSEMPITYTHRIFKGYSLNRDDSTHLIDPSYVVKDNITVYAQYNVDSTKDCEVEWCDGATKLDSETYFIGDKPTFKGTIPIHQTEVFDHWYPTPSEITQQQAEAGEVITYTAVYVPAYYTVTLDYNDKGGTTENLHYQYVFKDEDHHISEPSITYTGYKLTKWTYVTGGSGDFTFDKEITQDIKIKANWEAIKPTVSWYTEEGALVGEPQVYNYNDSLVLPDDSLIPAIIRGRNRFFFKKWLPNATAGAPVTEDMDFYGIYEENNVINFSFSSDNFTIDGKHSFMEVFDYSEVGAISYTFDIAPSDSEFALLVNNERVDSGYEYDQSEGIINIDLHDSVFDKAIIITLEAK